MFAGILARAGLLLSVATCPALAQAQLSVRLVNPGAEQFVFRPARVTIRPGDILEFTVESGGPYVIGFEPADFGPKERAMMDAAIPNRTASLRSGVLPRPGSRLALVLPALPKGSYRFSAVTHIAYRMAGVLVVP
jgi:plastocyanin